MNENAAMREFIPYNERSDWMRSGDWDQLAQSEFCNNADEMI